VYNESATLKDILKKVIKQEFKNITLEKEIILVVDSRSNDGSLEIARNFVSKNSNSVLIVAKEEGKGFAMKLGYEKSSGDILLIQDADLEYNPNDYETLVTPILEGRTKFVLGERYTDKTKTGKGWKIRDLDNSQAYGHVLNVGGLIINSLMNILYRSHLQDQASMFKVIHRDILSMIKLESNRFELEVEMICKLLRKGIHPYQIPIKYSARGNDEGKKIRFFRDGWSYIRVIFKYRFYPKKWL
jgi:glycosyltransferase involved in cell wall biosynthesis